MRRLPPVVLLALVAVLLPAAPGAAQTGRATEGGVTSHARDDRLVRETVVRIRDPLPADAGPRPPACDTIETLRYRHVRGPRRPRDADAIAVLIPGFLGGAGSFDPLARNVVRTAAARGVFAEVWAIDRRANCLEDDTGIEAADRARDAGVAFDYYWRGREVDGRRFGGFVPPSEARFLERVGLEQTVRDWHTLVTTLLPDRRTRARRLVCGGHSLGGPLTAAFASWDFDGDPATTADAGYAQCAGLVGLDTTLDLAGGGGGSPGGPSAVLDALGGNLGASPYVNAPPLTPETIQVPAVYGVGALHHPGRTDNLPRTPETPAIRLSERVLFSRDPAHFATQRPSIREFTLSNETTLAGIFDDNSAGLSFLRTSVGQIRGGPLVDKNFPAPGDGTFALPEDPEAPLYRWEDFDAVRDPAELNDEGRPYTTRESEVTSIRDLARTMFEPPANFIEQYFPVRILTDVASAESGDRSGSLAALAHDGPAQRPVLLVQAGDSDDNGAPDDGPPRVSAEPPNPRPGSREVTLPGYNHLDVLTAHRRQNDGRREPASTELTAFLLRVTGARPRLAATVRPRRVRAGRTVRLRVRVRSAVRRCRTRAVARVGRHRARTRRGGVAVLRVRPRRAGRLRVRVSAPGCRGVAPRVRVLP